MDRDDPMFRDGQEGPETGATTSASADPAASADPHRRRKDRRRMLRSLRAVSPDKALIEADRITQSFVSDKGSQLTVLDDVSFTLYDGEIVAFLGRSGAGKSTLLRVLAGLVRPTKGTVSYRGEPLTGPNQGVALVFQTFALMPWLTVQANVELGLQARGVPRRQREKLALASIDSIGLDGFESAYPKELSGGMRQRVGIARALVLHPDALFMDEPFSALDVLTAENLRQEVLRLFFSDDCDIRSLLIITHNIEEAVQMADRVVVLSSNPGRVAASVPIDLPRPRDRHSAAFEATVDRLYGVLMGHHGAEADGATGDAGHMDGAPAADVAADAAGAPVETTAGTGIAITPPVAAAPAVGSAGSAGQAGLTRSMESAGAVSPANTTNAAGAGGPTGTSETETESETRTPEEPAESASSTSPATSATTTGTGTSAPATSTPAVSTRTTPTPTTPSAPPLPDATPGGITGLLDVLIDHGNAGVQLSDLASDLSFEVDDLFPLVDAGTLLGVLEVRNGRIRATKLGVRWCTTDILDRKRLFARMALDRVPLVRSIDSALLHSHHGSVHGELIVDLMLPRYGEIEARRQFATAVGWGRYGELFDYDADDDLLTLDDANPGAPDIGADAGAEGLDDWRAPRDGEIREETEPESVTRSLAEEDLADEPTEDDMDDIETRNDEDAG